MNNPEAQLHTLLEISPAASLHRDGGVICVLLPETHLFSPTGMRVMDTVLCPSGLGGYATRLLLEHRISEKGNLNWQQALLLGRSWHTWSWNQISSDQPWLRIFAEHARLLR
jgi:hypothetical protein